LRESAELVNRLPGGGDEEELIGVDAVVAQLPPAVEHRFTRRFDMFGLPDPSVLGVGGQGGGDRSCTEFGEGNAFPGCDLPAVLAQATSLECLGKETEAAARVDLR